ncbi:MAG: hypothetical protein HOP12_11570 [Candidatus Eisenbacteria bacterium]|uniref:Uncharacterized protein n=1 Tax=Eiseniibacteriota bacterium TaxID=2212470 RepID=A0A849SQ82_UNCEI|nr:hypothetical protein [Candidatus Eisenbacteria bacterium]
MKVLPAIRAHAPRSLVWALVVAGSWLTLVGAVASNAPDSTPKRRVYSVRDSPGWYPNVDPESMSVVLGRRPGASLVRLRFVGGAPSLDALGRAVCRALHRSNRDSLRALCVSEQEFREILWREFPESRPATGLQWDDAWRVLNVRLAAGTSEAVRDFGGHFYEFVRFEVDSTMTYRNFKLHSRLTLVARDDEGRTQRMTWLRAIAERKGSFKIYSTVD